MWPVITSGCPFLTENTWSSNSHYGKLEPSEVASNLQIVPLNDSKDSYLTFFLCSEFVEHLFKKKTNRPINQVFYQSYPSSKKKW